MAEPLPAEEIAALREKRMRALAARGWGIAEISADIRIAPDEVRRVLGPDVARQGLHSMLPSPPPAVSNREWSAEEDGAILAHYGPLSAAQLGERFGRTRSAVIGRANRLFEAERAAKD